MALWRGMRGSGQRLGLRGNPPIVLILDQFTDADGTALTAHTISPINVPGNAWVNDPGSGSGVWKINASNNAVVTGLGGSTNTWVTTETSEPNATVSVVVTLSAALQGNPIVRYTNSNNAWFVAAQATVFELYEVSGGTYTVRASTPVTLANGTPYTVKIQASATTMIGKIVGIAEITYGSASSNQNATKHGMMANNASVVMDAFTVTKP